MTQCPSRHICTTIQDDCDDVEGLDSSYSFREEGRGRGIRESYTYDERDLDPESHWKESELAPEYKSESEPISEPILKPVPKSNSTGLLKPMSEPKKIILLDLGSNPDNDHPLEPVSESDIVLPLRIGLELDSKVSVNSASEPKKEHFHESALEPAKGLLF